MRAISMNRWNEVTWYSRLAAIVLLIGALPALSFYVGTQYELAEQEIDSPALGQAINDRTLNFLSKSSITTSTALSGATTITSTIIPPLATTSAPGFQGCPNADCLYGFHPSNRTSGSCQFECVPNTVPVVIEPMPKIYSVSPSSGPVGTLVTIIGENFGANNTIDFETSNAASATNDILDDVPGVPSFYDGTLIVFTIPRVSTYCASRVGVACESSVRNGRYLLVVETDQHHVANAEAFTVGP